MRYTPDIKTFLDFSRRLVLDPLEPDNQEELWLQPADMDIGGGRMTLPEIDRLQEYPNARALTVSGLDQQCFEYLIRTYGQQFHTLRFFKNKRVEDWSLLSTLPELEYLFYFLNQRITQFWDMTNNRKLKGIVIQDFSRLKTLDGIQTAPNLEYFLLGDAVWDTSVVDSYRYFANTHVRYLGFTGRKILDSDPFYLAAMPELEAFDGLLYSCTIEQAAWVKANAAKNLDIGPIVNSLDDPHDGPYTEICFPWKQRRYPLSGNEARYQRDVERFEKLVEQYRGVPYDPLFPREAE